MSEIDPEIRRFTDQLAADWGRHPPFAELSPHQARAAAEDVRARWRQGGPSMERIDETDFVTAVGPMRLRSYRPRGARGDAALVYLHGGGFMMFSIDTHDRLMREYADAARLTVIGLDYALAPEHKFPVALEQVLAFLRELSVNRSRIALGGDSAGANLALAAAVRLRDAGQSGIIRSLLLNYGAFGPHVSDEAEATRGGSGALLNRAEIDVFWSNYLAQPADCLDPAVNLLSADLQGLPPVLLVVPECDILAEQSVALAAKMGAGADMRLYRGATHSFLEAMSISSLARRAIAESAAWLEASLCE